MCVLFVSEGEICVSFHEWGKDVCFPFVCVRVTYASFHERGRDMYVPFVSERKRHMLPFMSKGETYVTLA